MKPPGILLLTLAATLALASCGHSPPTQFYTLNAVPPAKGMAASVPGRVSVGHVGVPGTLDRQSIVLRDGPNRLEFSDQARWAAPLDGMIRRVLADDLRQRIGNDKVLPPGAPLPQGAVDAVTLNLQSFIGSRDGSVVLDGDWSVQDRGQQVLLTRHAHLSRQVDGRSIDAIIAAQSDLLGELSDTMAQTLAAKQDAAARRGA